MLQDVVKVNMLEDLYENIMKINFTNLNIF